MTICHEMMRRFGNTESNYTCNMLNMLNMLCNIHATFFSILLSNKGFEIKDPKTTTPRTTTTTTTASTNSVNRNKRDATRLKPLINTKVY